MISSQVLRPAFGWHWRCNSGSIGDSSDCNWMTTVVSPFFLSSLKDGPRTGHARSSARAVSQHDDLLSPLKTLIFFWDDDRNGPRLCHQV